MIPMHILFKYFLIVMCVFTVPNALAGDNPYIFDPLNPHHSLFIPNGSGPFPAVLLLHASTGIEKINYNWAYLLRDNGYVVYIIDSFKPRGWESRSAVGWDKATAAQLADVAPAYAYLSHLSYVDAKRIALLGFSMGGFTVLRFMERDNSHGEKLQNTSFKAAASFYGVCHRLAPQTQLKGVTKIFIGSNDDRATTNDCLALIARSHDPSVTINVYPQALHGFDNYEFPASKEVVDERGEHYHIGYNVNASEISKFDLLQFFKTHLSAT